MNLRNCKDHSQLVRVDKSKVKQRLALISLKDHPTRPTGWEAVMLIFMRIFRKDTEESRMVCKIAQRPLQIYIPTFSPMTQFSSQENGFFVRQQFYIFNMEKVKTLQHDKYV